jgi:phosphoribosylformylglycinamidine synthase I
MQFGVITFPGSNCDHDCYYVLHNVLNQPTDRLWHDETNLPASYLNEPKKHCIVVPGGFSYGDYLRCGAIARFAHIMDSVAQFAGKGGLVIGICNGFQILTEAGLLPGVLQRNTSLQFICKDVFIRTENEKTAFTGQIKKGQVLQIPIAHAEGNYYADNQTIKELEANGQIIFKYCTSDGKVTDKANPNGAIANIAGICNKEGNVLGMMPHPERAAEAELGSKDGLLIWKSILDWANRA